MLEKISIEKINYVVKRQSVSGYTLLELMVCLAITGVLFLAAASTWRMWLMHSRAETVIYRLIGAINLARSTAIKHHVTVTLCPYASDEQCGNNWSNGWLVFIDNNGNGTKGPQDKVIHIDPPLAQGSFLSWHAFPSNQYLRINAAGYMLEQNGSFVYQAGCDQAVQVHRLILSKTARVRIAN